LQETIDIESLTIKCGFPCNEVYPVVVTPENLDMKFVVLIIALLSLSVAVTGIKRQPPISAGKWIESTSYAYIEISGK
jgi:hypothetical protein